MDDGNIIELFFARSEDAIAELDGKYGNICKSVAMKVLSNEEDAEECVNTSYFSVWNSIPPNSPSSLLAFVCKIVRNTAISRFRENSAEKRRGNYSICIEELEGVLAAPSTIEDEISVEALSIYINEFLKDQSKTNRIIFVRRFWYMDSYEDISKLTGIREGSVRTRLSRTKNNLKKFLIKKGVSV